MNAISPDMRMAAPPAKTWAARMSPWPVTVRKDIFIMAQPAFSNTLSALSQDELDIIQATADVWRSRGYGRTADNLLVVAGLTVPSPRLSAPPPSAGVTDLSVYRARRLAVS